MVPGQHIKGVEVGVSHVRSAGARMPPMGYNSVRRRLSTVWDGKFQGPEARISAALGHVTIAGAAPCHVLYNGLCT